MQYEGTLSDGRAVRFRPIRPEDKEILRRGFEMLSPESRYRRFFRHLDHLSDDQLRYLTEVDLENHYALLAVLPGPPEIGVGVARWVRIPAEPDVAEGAVTVLDSFHNQGIGTTLLWLSARTAVEAGVRAFRVWVQGENIPMLAILHDLGADPKHWESGVTEIDIPLPSDPDLITTTPATLVLKATATGEIVGEASPYSRTGTQLFSPGTGRRHEGAKDSDAAGAPDRT